MGVFFTVLGRHFGAPGDSTPSAYLGSLLFETFTASWVSATAVSLYTPRSYAATPLVNVIVSGNPSLSLCSDCERQPLLVAMQ